MVKLFRELFGEWTLVKDTGFYRYYEKGDKRKVIRYSLGGHQPVCFTWLKTGEWYEPKVPQ